MFNITADQHTIDEVKRYLEEGNLVRDMNSIAVDFTAMAFIVNAIEKEMIAAQKLLNEGTDEDEQ